MGPFTELKAQHSPRPPGGSREIRYCRGLGGRPAMPVTSRSGLGAGIASEPGHAFPGSRNSGLD